MSSSFDASLPGGSGSNLHGLMEAAPAAGALRAVGEQLPEEPGSSQRSAWQPYLKVLRGVHRV